MKLLVIGGSRFVGRHLVDAALARGDTVTLFNRGQSSSGRVPGAEHRVGDRQGDLAALASGEWDAVIDTCGFLPRDVARMAACLHGRVGRYVFISSVSAYADARFPNDESAALGRIDDPDTEVVDGRTYGPLKALCEQAVSARFGPRALLIRPGLIVGPHDPTQRFTWWPARIARAADGEAVLAPGAPEAAVQFIDARDLAAFVLHAVDTACEGAFNVSSVPGTRTLGEVLRVCAAAAGCQPRLVWADAAALAKAGVNPWIDMPLWLPAEGEHAAFMQVPVARALAAGLRLRPLQGTVADTLAWYRALPPEQQAFTQAGLAPEREAAVLVGLGR